MDRLLFVVQQNKPGLKGLELFHQSKPALGIRVFLSRARLVLGNKVSGLLSMFFFQLLQLTVEFVSLLFSSSNLLF